MEYQTGSDGAVLFCRKCGRRLIPGSQFCSSCGARIADSGPAAADRQEVSGTVPTTETMGASGQRMTVETAERPAPVSYTAQVPEVEINEGHRGKLLVFVILALVLALLGTCIYAAWRFLPQSLPDRTVRQDINEIDGCPEFYDVKFGMTVEEASALIRVEHEAYPAEKDTEKGLVVVDEDAGFSIHGLPVSKVFCGFDGPRMDNVIIVFSGGEVSFGQVVDLYTGLYGTPTQVNATSARWLGRKTVIWIVDGDEEHPEVDAYYKISPNKKFTQFIFDGPEYDPCNFLTTDVFSKRLEDYTAGLTLDEDFVVEENDYFCEYTFYPYFEYMGIDDTNTAISLQRDASGGNITVCNYLFWLDESNAADRMTYIKDTLTREYGTYSSCDYTSLRYGELGMVDLSIDEMLAQIDSGTQGIYHLQWEKNGVRVTLGLTIYSDRTYFSGSVSMSSV